MRSMVMPDTSYERSLIKAIKGSLNPTVALISFFFSCFLLDAFLNHVSNCMAVTVTIVTCIVAS